jgi:hypothetical protein
MIVRTPRTSCFTAVSTFLLCGTLAHGASFTGTVTNKTTNKASAGDTVVLVDVQAGMAEAASTTTNAAGQYTLAASTLKPYLIRVNHQGGTYFIAAPQSGPGDVTVYDVAAKVEGVGIDADMLMVEAGGGMLRIQERYLVRNASLPPKAQFSDNTFEIVLPSEAELDAASATRPGGLATNTHLLPLGQKGHYSFNVPIQPNQGEKETLFEVQYHISYSGKYTFTPHLLMPADNFVVYAAKGIDFSGDQGAHFQPTQEDPRVQTFVAKNIHPGQAISFAVSGEGQMPRDAQGAMGQQNGMADTGDASAGTGRPGGGLGPPIDSPDPLTKYKWWILSGLTLVLILASALLLKKRVELAPVSGLAAEHPSAVDINPLSSFTRPITPSSPPLAVPSSNRAALLSILKEELFAIESEKLSGTLSSEEYAAIRTGLEAVLRRALKSQ